MLLFLDSFLAMRDDDAMIGRANLLPGNVKDMVIGGSWLLVDDVGNEGRISGFAF